MESLDERAVGLRMQLVVQNEIRVAVTVFVRAVEQQAVVPFAEAFAAAPDAGGLPRDGVQGRQDVAVGRAGHGQPDGGVEAAVLQPRKDEPLRPPRLQQPGGALEAYRAQRLAVHAQRRPVERPGAQQRVQQLHRPKGSVARLLRFRVAVADAVVGQRHAVFFRRFGEGGHQPVQQRMECAEGGGQPRGRQKRREIGVDVKDVRQVGKLVPAHQRPSADERRTRHDSPSTRRRLPPRSFSFASSEISSAQMWSMAARIFSAPL